MTSPRNHDRPFARPIGGQRYCDERDYFGGIGKPLRTPAAAQAHVLDFFGDCPGLAVLHLDSELRLRCDRSILGGATDVLADLDGTLGGHLCPSRDVIFVCQELRNRRSLLKRHHTLFDAVRAHFAEEGVRMHDLVVRDGLYV